MTKQYKIRIFYGIFLIVMTVACAAAFIIAASQIYYGAEGASPYSVDTIKAHILAPAILLILWAAAVIAGAVLTIIFPVALNGKAKRESREIFLKMKSKLPESAKDGFEEQFNGAKNSIKKAEIARVCIWGGAIAVFAAAAIAVLAYAFNFSHYHANDTKGDILNIVRNVLSWTAAGVACGIAAVIAEGALSKKQIEKAKVLIKTGRKARTASADGVLAAAVAEGADGAINASAGETPKEIKNKAVIASSVAAGGIALLAVAGYILLPILTSAVLNAGQTVMYVVAFIIAAVIAAAFTGYYFIKGYVPEKVNRALIWAARAAVGIAAITFIIVGVFNGGAHDVLIKAINICTECVGLG